MWRRRGARIPLSWTLDVAVKRGADGSLDFAGTLRSAGGAANGSLSELERGKR